MGTWGPGTLDNDVAGDWLEVAAATSLPDAAAEAFRHVDEVGQQYLDGDTALVAIAAGELIRRWYRRDGEGFELPPGQPPAHLARAAGRALRRVLAPPSELLELWVDADDEAAWRGNIGQLVEDLESAWAT